MEANAAGIAAMEEEWNDALLFAPWRCAVALQLLGTSYVVTPML